MRSGVALQIKEQDDRDSLQVAVVGKFKSPSHVLSFLSTSIFSEPHWQIIDLVNAGSTKSTQCCSLTKSWAN